MVYFEVLFGVTFRMHPTFGLQISLDNPRSSLSLFLLSRYSRTINSGVYVYVLAGERRLKLSTGNLLAHLCANLVGHTSDWCSIIADQPNNYPRHLYSFDIHRSCTTRSLTHNKTDMPGPSSVCATYRATVYFSA